MFTSDRPHVCLLSLFAARFGWAMTASAPPAHEARGADKRITDAIGVHVQAEHLKSDDDDGSAAAFGLLANGPLMARKIVKRCSTSKAQVRDVVPGLGLRGLERVTGIEPALSAWETERLHLNGRLTCRSWRPGVAVSYSLPPWLIAR